MYTFTKEDISREMPLAGPKDTGAKGKYRQKKRMNSVKTERILLQLLNKLFNFFKLV